MAQRQRATQTDSNDSHLSFAGAIWLVTATVWFVSAIVLSFLVGGMALAVPFLSFLKDWSKEVTLYDLCTGIGYLYAILMAAIGATISVITAEDYRSAWFIVIISLLGVVILILLVAGKLIS